MILEETINKIVRDMTNLILLIPNYTIRAKQKDAPRPTGAYADVDFVSDAAVGWEQFEHVDQPTGTKIDFTTVGMRDIMISINFYRDSAVDNARKVRQGFVRESINAFLNAANLSLIRRSDVREVSEALENTWEERAQFDIFLSAVGTDTDIIESIGSVDIAGEFQARNLVYNFEIEV